MRCRRLIPCTLTALCATLILALPAAAGVRDDRTKQYDNWGCYPSWTWNACAHITNDVVVITAPGVVEPTRLRFLAANGLRKCAQQYDVTREIPPGATRVAQADNDWGADCVSGTFAYEALTAEPYRAPTVAGAVHVGKRGGETSVSKPTNVEETNECVRQSYVWCDRVRTWNPKLRDTEAAFRLSTRPLLVQIVNNTPNPIQRVPDLVAASGLWYSRAGDNARAEIGPNGGSAWMGGLRRTGSGTCPDEPQTGKPDPDCVAAKLVVARLGAVFRFLPPSGPVASDYAGGQAAFTVRVRSDGVRSSTCTPMYRPTLAPLTCSVEFGGSDDGVLTATVTLKTSGT